MTEAASGAREPEPVRGERTVAIGSESRSAQSRLSSLLSAALMIALGVLALIWYYAHAFTGANHARQTAQSNAASRAQGEMTLPSLGPVLGPVEPPPAASAPPAPVASAAATASDLPLEPHPIAPGAGVRAAPATADARPHRASALERRLSGAVFTRDRLAAPSRGAADPAGLETPSTPPSLPARAAAEGAEGAFTALLHPSATAAVAARLLPTAHLLLPKGAFIDCTLETAIDSTLQGMTTCITAADTFGADGKVVLLERGTKLVGETRGEVRQGQARVFVVWTEARTPTGVIVPLDSPGTDELGRSGLPGEVKRHFFQRFGAAMLVSLIDGAVQAGVQASSRSGGAVIYTPSGSQEVLTEVLKDTLRIPPTVVKHNGERIEVLVARDIDFRPVYELRASATGR